MGIDWEEVVFANNGLYLQLAERLALRRFSEGVLAEEAVAYVIEHLSAENWQKCRSYRGRSSIKTFLQALISNLLEEFSRKKFGRPRPPAWLARHGELWVNIWKRLCLERQPTPSLVDRYTHNNAYQKSWIEHVIRTIKAEVKDCGKKIEDPKPAEDFDNVLESTKLTGWPIGAAEMPGGDAHGCGFDVEARAAAELLLMLRTLLDDSPNTAQFSEQSRKQAMANAGANQKKLQNLRENLQLSDEERLVLRMIYSDGMAKTAVSRALKLPDHQAGLIAKKALARIRDALTQCGIDLESLLRKV